MKTIVIGLGGIGGFLVEPLARSMAVRPGLELLLVDGDSFTESNRDRQYATRQTMNHNKAESWAARLKDWFPLLSIRAKPEYVSERNIEAIVTDDSTVFLCVDNHATRKLVSDRCQRLRDVLLISGGNEYHDGNVQVFAKRNGRRVSGTRPLDTYHPEIASPRDRNPAELSCEELAQLPSGGQLIATNLMAASLMLNAQQTQLLGSALYGEVYFDITTNTARSVQRS